MRWPIWQQAVVWKILRSVAKGSGYSLGAYNILIDKAYLSCFLAAKQRRKCSQDTLCLSKALFFSHDSCVR